jgi:uncharacterized protein (DUF697 family)
VGQDEQKTNDEVLSGLRVLVALARADGVVHENERLAIESALDGVALPKATTAERLLADDVDLDAELAIIKSPSIKQQTFDSACALVFVDGEASDVERTMLERVRAAFELGDQEAASVRFRRALDRAFAPLATDRETSSKRDFALDDEVRRFAIFGAALASLTLPSFCTGVNLSNDVRMARKVGTFYGQLRDGGFWRTFVGNIVGAASSWLAMSSLAKMAGLAMNSRATSAFSTTWALGRATKLYFEKEEALDPSALRKVFKEAKQEGLAAAKQAYPTIEEKRTELEKGKRELDKELLEESIDEATYEERLLALD